MSGVKGGGSSVKGGSEHSQTGVKGGKPHDEKDKAIRIVQYNLKAKENSQQHHTDQYEHVTDKVAPSLVLRRGDAFEIDVDLSRAPDTATERLGLIMELGKSQSGRKTKRVMLPINRWVTHREPCHHGWAVELKRARSHSATIAVHISPNAIVGCWSLKIVMAIKQKASCDMLDKVAGPWGKVFSLGIASEIYILFNPWCKEDPVYMENADDRNEYVLNDVGKIFRGTYRHVKASTWVFGQFQKEVLIGTMAVLEYSKLPLPNRADPVRLSRVISAMANSANEHDPGVLAGRWEKDYPGGTAPSQWTGSIKILKQYAEGNGEAVKYGQCWVFAGLICSICRCLGIPCRVVTNYKSAHDTDTTLTIDYHIDSDGRPLKERNKDSIWNYHCWNEVWMTRPVLGKEYSGWQVIDGTPQETSQGTYQLGPTPVVAVRKAEVEIQHDTSFVFSEVNADVFYWLVLNGEPTRITSKDQTMVGKMIVTKRPGPKLFHGCGDMMNITEQYKPKEGTKEERLHVMQALASGGYGNITKYEDEVAHCSDVKFHLDVSDETTIGDDFTIKLEAKNTSKECRNVCLYLRVDAVLYSDKEACKVKAIRGSVELKPNCESSAKLEVPEHVYLPRLKDQSMFAVHAVAYVTETGQLFTAKDDFRLQKPDISMTISKGQPTIFQNFEVCLKFTNPLEQALTKGKYSIDGPGLCVGSEIDAGTIMPKAESVTIATICPWKSGNRKLVARFTSDELTDLDGFINIDVKDK